MDAFVYIARLQMRDPHT